MSDMAYNSVVRQAKAYLAVKDAQKALNEAKAELMYAERSRLRPSEPLTVIIDGLAITSHRPPPGEPRDPFEYTTSKVLS